MKRIFFSVFLSIGLWVSSFAQIQAFTIEGQAKKILYATSKSKFPIEGILFNGDKIQININQLELIISTEHNNLKQQITKQQLDANSEVAVYECDFEKDGNKEIIQYSAGLSKKIGFLISGQGRCTIDKNIIHFPFINSQGDIGSTYLYQKGAFYELVYHNPTISEESYLKSKK